MPFRIRADRSRRRETGLTLLEVLVAVGLLGLALTPMIGMMSRGLAATHRVESLSRSLMLAESAYEEVRARAQSTLAPFGFDRDYSRPATPFQPPDQDYVLEIVDDRKQEMRSLRITVWHDANGSRTVDEGEIPVVIDTQVTDRS